MVEEKYKKAFLEEAYELAEHLNNYLLQLSKNTEDTNILNELFRYTHSIKSEAALLGYTGIAECAHTMEDLFDAIRNKTLTIDKDILKSMLSAADFILDNLNLISSKGIEKRDKSVINELMRYKQNVKKEQKKIQKTSYEPDGNAVTTLNLDDFGDQKKVEEFEKLDDITFHQGKSKTFESIEKKFHLTEFNKDYIKSLEDTEIVFDVEVKILDSSEMKYPRAYLVFNNLQGAYEVIASYPDIEKETDDSLYSTVSFLVRLSRRYNKREFYKNFEVDEITHVTYHEVQLEAASYVVKDENIKYTDITVKKTLTSTIRIDVEKLDAMGRSVGELITNRSRFSKILEYIRSGENIDFIYQQLEESESELIRISDEVQRYVMQLRMVPIDIIFSKFPRVVHDIADKLDKKVDLIIKGRDTEIDKKVIEEIQDPITHMIRNSIDHGIETSKERIKKGKSSTGKIVLNAYQEGSQIYIEVTDDGLGVDFNKIKEKIKKIEPNTNPDKLTQEELLEYLFRSGFSTKKEITELSGRGVGLDVVREQVSNLRGRVEIQTVENQGTTLKIVLPLTLTIMEVLLVKSKQSYYAVPIYAIEQTDRIPVNTIEQIEKYDIIRYRNEIYTVLYLSELVGKDREIFVQDDLVYIVIVKYQQRKICILIDDLIGEQDIVVQPLDDIFKGLKGISGVAILGDGAVSLILDIPEIIKEYVEKTAEIIDRLTKESNSLVDFHDKISKIPLSSIDKQKKKNDNIIDYESNEADKNRENISDIKPDSDALDNIQFEFLDDSGENATEISITDLT